MISTMVGNAIDGLRTIFAAERIGMSLNDPETWKDLTAGSDSAAGVKVDERTMLSIAPVFQGVSTIAGDIAGMTRYVYRRLPNGDSEYATKHQANRVLSWPNKNTTRVRLWRNAMTHALLWGNAYIYVERSQVGNRLLGLYNLLPDRTSPVWVDGELSYLTYLVTGKSTLTPRVLSADKVLHIQGLSLDCKEGCNLAQLARDTWGLAVGSVQYAGRFFRRGGRRGGILEVPTSMTKKSADNLEQGFRKKYEDPEEAFKTIVLRDNAKFHDAQISPRETQMVESREADARAAARFLNIPPSKLGIQGSVSYNSREQEQQAYYTGTLWHWSTLIDGECELKLLTDAERQNDEYYIEHNTSKLIEADWKTLNEGLALQRQNEIISANEWRRKINLNRRPDPGGDEYVNPNTKSAGASAGGDNGDGNQPPANVTGAAIDAVLADAQRRIVARIGKHVRRAAKKPTELQAWIDDGGSDYRAIAAKDLQPWAGLVSAQGGESPDIEAKAAGIVDAIVNDLRPFLDPPYKSAELTTNVDRAMTRIEATFGINL